MVGDYMLALALKNSALTGITRLIDVFSLSAMKLADGEIVQLDNVNNTAISEDVYFHIIKNKTAALFASCAESGALTVGASEEDLRKLYEFGETIGICFQIRDDIFDYYSKDVGKPTGNDMREGKLTLPAIYAVNHSDDEEVREKALRIRSLTASEDEIQEFIQYVINSGGIDYARGVMAELHDKALRCIPESAPQDVIDGLKAYLNFVSDREI